MSECLGDETIAAMLEGALAGDRVAHAHDHIATCDACRELVSAAVVAGPARSIATVAGGGGDVGRSRVVLPARELGPGTVIGGRYRITRPLGEGGMGRVFEARQIGLERPVAIKVLLPELARDAQALARFHREARLVASLRSEHVVRVHDLGELPSGEPYLVMELLDGEDLGTIVERGPIAWEHVRAWTLAACEALGEAHALGITHRDVKPSNLFVTRQGRLVVLDFGLAKLAAPHGHAGASMTAVGMVLGSPRYMAPEQIMGASAAGARADIWSLGATIYHLVTGRAPFPEATVEAVFASIMSGRQPPLDMLPPAVAGAVHRALAYEPEHRFATMSQLATALGGGVPSVPVVDGRYELIELLGEGGHGAVWRARQRPHGREVAVKLVKTADPALRERFAREAAIVQRLEHPNTVRMLEAGIAQDGTPFMVFELVRGRTLAADLARGPLDETRVARIGAQVLKALMEAHAAGVVHRDVTPRNVLLVDHAGEPDFVKLCDFGVAVDAEGPNITSTGQIIGTPRYMAPEQVTGGAVDGRCDLYALGLVMAEMLSGRPVFDGPSAMAVCVAQASPAPVPLPPEVTRSWLGGAIARATAKRPEERFPTAAGMLQAVTGPPVMTGQAHLRERARRRRTWLPILAAICAALAIGAIAYVATRSSSTSEPEPPRDIVVNSQNDGKVELGNHGKVELGGGVVQAQPPTGTPHGSGPLGNLDEGRIRARVEKAGWKVKEIDRQSFPLCNMTRMQMESPEMWGDAYLFECSSEANAQSEGRRLRNMPYSWTVDDGNLVVQTAAGKKASFGDEVSSKKLYDIIVTP